MHMVAVSQARMIASRRTGRSWKCMEWHNNLDLNLSGAPGKNCGYVLFFCSLGNINFFGDIG